MKINNNKKVYLKTFSTRISIEDKKVFLKRLTDLINLKIFTVEIIDFDFYCLDNTVNKKKSYKSLTIWIHIYENCIYINTDLYFDFDII